MFSFFRKSRASKDLKSTTEHQQPANPIEDEAADIKLAEGSKKKLKSDKKINKDKKVSFKDHAELVTLSDDSVKPPSLQITQRAPENSPVTARIVEKTVPVVVPVNNRDTLFNEAASVVLFRESDDNNCSQSDEPPDVFCEAQETIQPDVIASWSLSTSQSSQPTCVLNAGDVSGLSALNSEDKQLQNLHDKIERAVEDDVNAIERSSTQDVTRKPIVLEKSNAEVSSAASFLSGGSSVQHEIPIVRLDAGMSTEKSQDEFAIMEEQIRQLASELREKNERVEQLEAILADDERLAQLETIERLEADWTKEHELVLNEREEELRLLQEALEEALEEKAEMEAKMLRDASRETQLLDDFEWKLGEIEKDYKKKLTEAEKTTEERVKKEMAAEYQQLVDDKKDIDEKLAEIAHLKSYEAEVTQLRGLIHEQQRAIRVAARQIDQVRLNERLLQDDLNKIRTQGYTRKQQQELEEKWEEKTQTECNRLRAELIATNEEEMLKAIRQVVHEKDDQINALKRQFEAQQVALNHQINELKNSFQQREAKLNKQLETTRTAADRELNDLRRQLNKVQDSHVELLEQIERKHAEELERFGTINSESQGTMEQEFQEKLQSVEVQHQSQLNALQALIEEEKQEALIQLGEHYQNQLQSLQEHIGDLQKRLSDANKLSSQKQEELQKLHDIISEQERQLEELRSEQQEKSNNEMQISRRPSSGGSSTADSSGEDGYEESTPPTGRSAGDGCSPSTSAATIQDNLRPTCTELDGTLTSSKHPVLTAHHPYSADVCLSVPIEQLEQVQPEFMCCDDPEHAEAQQIILEMHQVLADRDAELQRLTEEKRFYQLELIHWERNLALQRVGLPLALVPDRLSNESELNPWRGYSAPPVTKPRLPDSLQLSTAAAFSGSRAASYELFSPSATSLSPEVQCGGQIFPVEHPSTLLTPGDWALAGMTSGADQRQLHWPPPQGSHFYYSDDDNEDSNNNGFTTPL